MKVRPYLAIGLVLFSLYGCKPIVSGGRNELRRSHPDRTPFKVEPGSHIFNVGLMIG